MEGMLGLILELSLVFVVVLVVHVTAWPPSKNGRLQDMIPPTMRVFHFQVAGAPSDEKLKWA